MNEAIFKGILVLYKAKRDQIALWNGTNLVPSNLADEPWVFWFDLSYALSMGWEVIGEL